MGQDLKCFFGVHKFEIVKELEVKDIVSDDVNSCPTVGINIIRCCTNCGKLKSRFVASNINNLNNQPFF